jgi:outer membrane receptor protein involved in Fe transport
MCRCKGRFAPLLLAMVLASRSGWAGTAADLRGKVVDKNGSPLAGATVVVRNDALAVGERGAVTDAEGNYRILRLPPGRGYRVRVSLPTFAPVEFSEVELTTDQVYVLDVVLRSASDVQETIRVQGHADLVDTESVVTSTVFSSEFISGLPVLGRDYQDVLSLAPGVTDVNNTGNPNIHGARDTDVVTLVDGVSTTDPFTGYYGQQLNIESIEQIEVITSGATAEFSRAQGGFANIITKSGGNEFQGSFKFFMRSYRLDGDGAGIDPPDVRGGLGEVQGLRDLNFTDLYPFLSLSGAMIKDHLWYYLANEFIQVETPINAVTQAFVTRTRGLRTFGKSTWQINQAQKLVFSVTLDRTRQENQGLDSATQVESGYQFERGGPTYTLKETAVFSPGSLLESAASWFDNHFQRSPTLDPDTNHNGILFVDNRPDLGGNQDGFFQARERDPGEDYDRDGAYDLFEDFNHNGRLDFNEDRDGDGRLTPPGGCEGKHNEDINCNGLLDQEFDLNQNGVADPNEDLGIPGVPGTAGNGKFDSEDVNHNNLLDTVGDSGPTSFPFWVDKNNDHRKEPGEYRAPLAPDRDYTQDVATGRVSGPNPYEYGDNRKRMTLREDFSFYRDVLGGSHDVKMGIVFEHEGFDRNTELRPVMEKQIRQGLSSAGTIQQGGTVTVHLPTIPSIDNTATGNNLGLYIQDTYKPLPNLTVGLGVRVDFEDLQSFGHTLFDPRQERREFDGLMGLTNVETEANDDLNADGVIDVGLGASDPIYKNSPSSENALHLAQLNTALKKAAVTRFTRHEFEVQIQSAYLSSVLGRDASADDLLAAGIKSRQPEDIRIQNANVAPRLSLTWDPWADGKSKGFASWNRYYDKLFLNTMVLEEGPDTVTRYYAYDANGVDNFGRPDNQIGHARTLAPPSAFQVDRGLSTPYTDELTLGFERELAPECSLSITYIHRDYKNQLQDIDLNHTTRRDPRTGRFTDNFGTEPISGGFGDDQNAVFLPRVPDQHPDLYIENIFFNRVFRLGNYNTQTYRGVEMELIKRLSRKWQMQGSYTFSRSMGDAESFLSDNGDDPTLTEFESGFLNYDQRHVVKVNALTYLPGDWRLSGTAQWASGLPYSIINTFVAQDNVGYSQSRRRFGYVDPTLGFITEHRNIHRNQAVYTFNVSTEKSFVIGRTSASAFLEVFNLLNTDDLRVYSIDPSRSSLQADAERRFGRRYQIGIRLDF